VADGSGTVSGRVIQGFFIGGAMRPQAVRGGATGGHAAPATDVRGTGTPVQARVSPGRPPLVDDAAGRVAQRHGGNGSFEVDPAVVGLARTGGAALPPAVLAKMEAAFGTDFSTVRVHVGPQASRIGAIAFTTGNDLYFAPGQFQPESIQGQQLIGHELAHVVQQRQGRVRAPGSGVAVVQDRMLEAEADRLGMHAAAHRAPVQAKMAGHGHHEAPVHISAPGSNAPGRYRLTAGPGANPIGSLVVHTRRGAAAEVTDLGVDARFRDRGIGRQLLVSAARAGLRSGNSKLSLAAQDNGSGRLTRWYKDLGFHQVGVNNRGMPMLEAPISRLLAGAVQPKLAPATGLNRPQPPVPCSARSRAIQRAEVAVQMVATDYTDTFLRWLKKNDNSKNGCNYSVGRTKEGNYIVSKVGGIGANAEMIKSFVAHFSGRIGTAKVYAAKPFASGSPSGNHAEMCIAAANNMEAGALEKIFCTDPNCALCAQQLSDMKITGGTIGSGEPGTQGTWCHPTAKAYFGTQYGEGDMAKVAKALKDFNKLGTIKNGCGSVVYSQPCGSLVQII
jgi:ribosomal protein S18 acetylase RimI-like enzyme